MTEDARDYLGLVLGLWFHTRASHGKPTIAEALGALKAGGFWTKSEREELVCRFALHGQIGDMNERHRAMWDDYFVPRGASIA